MPSTRSVRPQTERRVHTDHRPDHEPDHGWSADRGRPPAALRAGFLAQVQEAAQPYTGLAWLPGRTIRGCDRTPRGEQLLDRKRGFVIGGRDLHDSQARLCHVRVSDLPHAWHYAPQPAEVLRPWRLHPTE